MKQIGKQIVLHIGIVVGASIVGLALLYLVHCLPVNTMAQHVFQSQELIVSEFEDGVAIKGYPATLTGNFTDCLMLQYAIYENSEHSRLEQILQMYRGERMTDGTWSPGYSLIDYLNGVKNGEMSYSRYWHGYLVVLKPLLWLTNVSTLRVLTGNIQLLLLGICVVALCKRNQYLLSFGMLITMPFMYFVSMYTTLSLSICFYLMAIGVLGTLWLEYIKAKNVTFALFFLTMGMLTSYFDFLTYPLITLGVPLGIYLVLSKDEWKQLLCKLVVCSAEWSVGYVGLWAMKWIWTALLTGSDSILDALTTVKERTGIAGEGVGENAFAVIMKNVDPFLNMGYLPWALVCGVGAAYLIIKNWNLVLKNWKKAMVLVVVAMYPVGWYVATTNHSFEHWMFTCKTLAVMVFAFVCVLAKLLQKDE